MKELIDYINEKSNNAYTNLKLIGVVFNKDTNKTCFRFVYKSGTNFKQSDKDELLRLVRENYGNTIDAEVKVKRDYIDTEVVTDMCYKYLVDNYSSISGDISKQNISVLYQDGVYNITVTTASSIYDYMISRNVARLLQDYLCNNSFESFSVITAKDDSVGAFNKAIEEKQEVLMNMLDTPTGPSKISIDNIVSVFGDGFTNTAYDISTIKGPMQRCQIAGNVRYFLQKSFVSKRPDKDGNYPEKKYYSWTLGYGGSSMQCVYFPLKSDENNDFALAEGMSIAILGDVEEYNGRLNFKVRSLASCDIVNTPKLSVNKKVNDNYLYVKPEKVETMQQSSFFDQKPEPNAFLKANDVVVFDVETTGLDYKTNEIIEIGAVKLHEGEITESFSCFVKPSTKIPSDITKLTGITDSMVANAYSINQVIVDFYKFCYGTVIMAYNIDFDFKFINSAGIKAGYRFDNRQVDAMYLARKEVKGAKNFTLSSICKRLGVSLEGAHRAINDATATAEVVKLISNNVSAS